MEKKGFTLAEILGVVVIIGLLLLLIVPTVINRLNSSKDDVATASEDIIYNAADQYIKEHPEKFPPGWKILYSYSRFNNRWETNRTSHRSNYK